MLNINISLLLATGLTQPKRSRLEDYFPVVNVAFIHSNNMCISISRAVSYSRSPFGGSGLDSFA